MTEAQLHAKIMIKRNSKHLSGQQSRTLNGLVKEGRVVDAMNGLHTILARKFAEKRLPN